MRTLLGALLALTLLLTLPGLADAQCGTFTTHRRFSHGHVVTEVVKEVVTPVAVAVPFAVVVPGHQVNAAAFTYATVQGQQAVAPAAPAPTAASVDALAEAVLQRIEQRLGLGGTAAPRVTPPDGGPPPVPHAAAPKPSPVRAASRDRVQQILTANRCATCHSGEATQGKGYKIFDHAGTLLEMDFRKAQAISDEVMEGTMPKGGPEVPPEQAEEIRLWAKALRKQER